MAYRDAGDGSTWLQAYLNNLGFERFGIKASLAHKNPDVMGDIARRRLPEDFNTLINAPKFPDNPVDRRQMTR